ncbi:hypothetical protein [Methylobacterium sp. WL9]|uniref:hypothetical protein n=1 Tax=Methylobacterium sp. WL9 TaxID=2603898 RepID=UPI0011C89EEB|nr:hypothetical protein [Methylobacterium sp. WL9]TXN19705.1 hypothetical protein FV217_20405 [Methylobacterium sp. WL9]
MMRHAIFALLTASLLTGCVSSQLNDNTSDISANVDTVYTDQVLNNLSKFIDNPHALPNQIIVSAGTVQTSGSVNPSVTFPFTPMIGRTLGLGSTGPTRQVANTIGGSGASLGASFGFQQNYNIAPVNDAIILRNHQSIYRYVMGYDVLDEKNYFPQRVFITDRFHKDPFFYQQPHCVLCAYEQNVFLRSKPRLYPNQKIRRKWLFWDDPVAMVGPGAQKDEFVNLGRYNNHTLYMTRRDYAAGVLSDLVFFTLPIIPPAEVFSSGEPPPPVQVKITNPEEIRPNSDEQSSEEKPKREPRPRAQSKPQTIIVPPAVSRSAPATNAIRPPLEGNQFNLIIPQQILPAQ